MFVWKDQTYPVHSQLIMSWTVLVTSVIAQPNIVPEQLWVGD